ncbi:MAG TPA: hypothetical protein PLW93_05555, partial [Candidatus Absconditabacterales bacterium]|nr:hypothetical protein [Candidatus Absconditabacterales bacterium]
ANLPIHTTTAKDDVTLGKQLLELSNYLNKHVTMIGAQVEQTKCEVMIPAWSKLALEYKNGEVEMSLEDIEHLLSLFGTRIPTQDKHSMISARVVDFLPTHLSDCIVMPYEAMFLSGEDFDADSKYTIREEFYEERIHSKNKKPFVKLHIHGNAETPEREFRDYMVYLREKHKKFKYELDILKENYSGVITAMRDDITNLQKNIDEMLSTDAQNRFEHIAPVLQEIGLQAENTEDLNALMFNADKFFTNESKLDNVDRYAKDLTDLLSGTVVMDFYNNLLKVHGVDSLANLVKQIKALKTKVDLDTEQGLLNSVKLHNLLGVRDILINFLVNIDLSSITKDVTTYAVYTSELYTNRDVNTTREDEEALLSEAVKYFNIAKKLNDSKPMIKKLTSKAKELKRALSVSADGQYLLNIPKLKTFVDTNKQLILDYVSTLNEEYEKLTQYKSQLNEFVRQLEIEALERCNLPTNYNQLQTAKSKDLYYNIYAVTNEMFQL